MSPDIEAGLRIAAAALGGLAVGIEREWSGHASGRFGGVRTFTLLGGLAGIAGWLWTEGDQAMALTLLAGAVGVVLVGYAGAALRDEVEATTEVAALVVVAAGVMAGIGRIELASGVIAVDLLLLVEKSRLHSMVRRLNDAELQAGSRFAVMAVVILPLLPPGPYGPGGGVRPRELWALVLLFAGLSFAGYIARRVVGAKQGYPVAGLLGGLASSTSVTLAFSRASRDEPKAAVPLAAGVVAASTVVFVRTLLAVTALRASLAAELLPLFAAPFAVGVLATVSSLRLQRGRPEEMKAPTNPLQLKNAIQMAILFQLVLYAVHFVREYAGDAGLLLSGVVAGLTDVDAVTVSMAKSVGEGVEPRVAALAIGLAILSNSAVKLVMALVVGGPRFRAWAAGGLATMAVALGAALALAY